MSFLKKWKGTALGAVAAPFTGGLSLAGGYLYDTNKQQNEANKKAIDRANAYDMYTWDLANQYNDPKAQMARLKAAGLNPNLVYGSGNVTGNTTGVASSNGVAQHEVFNGITKGMQTAQAGANLVNTWNNNKLLQYQMEKTDADRKMTEAQTTNLMNYLTGNGRSTYDMGRKFKDIWSSLFGSGDESVANTNDDSISGRLAKKVFEPLFSFLLPKPNDGSYKNPRNRGSFWNPGGWI